MKKIRKKVKLSPLEKARRAFDKLPDEAMAFVDEEGVIHAYVPEGQTMPHHLREWCENASAHIQAHGMASFTASRGAPGTDALIEVIGHPPSSV